LKLFYYTIIKKKQKKQKQEDFEKNLPEQILSTMRLEGEILNLEQIKQILNK
jgi:hypothetical protein